ncbi:MAG TPA: cyclic nucleotide-binding domain-containing protein [Bryobacteraceae bacterium]|nr:cyclic nucleotide-binding domain-containing protein [Bryobacteraceae bacterium]
MIALTDFLESTGCCEFLQGLERSQLERLAGLAKEARFKAGQVIFEEGQRHGRFFLLSEGGVALETGGRVLAELQPGDALGWSSLSVSPGGAHFRARAVTPVRALAFDGAQLAAACEADPAFGYFIMKALLSVVTERLDATRLQLAARDQ